jgi:hypothetical protein
MTFTGSWFTPVVPVEDGEDGDRLFPEVYCCPTESEPPVRIPRNAIYDSDDEDSVDDVTPLSTDEEEMEVVQHRPKSHYWKKDKNITWIL